jgi:osmotically-inducible protein OsmY
MKSHTLPYSAVLSLSLSILIAGCSTYGECADGACGTDVAITTNVRSLLDQHAELGAPHAIDVQTLHRVVYLNGQVNDGFSRSIAEFVALQAPGVLQVVNSIAVEK